MDFEFDKEIDAILRKTRGGDDAAALTGAHPDADEIAAFAENALPPPARQRFTAHFADCARCRKILSNAFVYHTEAESETASSAVSLQEAEAAVPWYRKLFAFPQAAYAMGAMVLLFGGFFGYLILQNLPGANNEVSYSTNTAANRGAPAAAEQPAAISNSNATTTTTANAATNTPFQNANTTSSTANAARLNPSNTTTAVTPTPNALALPEGNAPVAEVQPMATPAPKPQVTENDDADQNAAQVAPATPNNSPTNTAALRREKDRNKEDSYSADSSVSGAMPDQKLKTARAVPNLSKKNESGAGATRSVGGKTFNNVGGIWFDSAVGKQKPKNVRRGTSEYQKLDAGLRSIADSLGGTVVILWGGRAYRIQ